MSIGADDRTLERTYGHWRAGARPGLFGLGPAGTGALFVVGAIGTGTMLISAKVAVGILVVGAVVLTPFAIRSQGRTAAQMIAARLSWWSGSARRRHMYVAGIASAATGTHQLPGLLAGSQVWEVESGRQGNIGVVVIPTSRHYTVTLRCETEGRDLVDPEVVDARVARLAGWLGSLTLEPMLVQASCTVETTPDPGTRLADEIATTTRDDAPALARAVLDEVVATYPTGSATVHTRVSLTFTPRTGRRTSDEAMCREIAARLPALQQGLEGTGVSTTTPMTAAELSAAVRSAYDPAVGAHLSRGVEDSGVVWEQAGPVAAREEWDHYRHDSGVSRTWGMVHAPRGVVFAQVFGRLTDPDPGLLRKRVTLTWRPYSPAEAARLVEADRKAAHWTANKKNRATARDEADVAAAERSAAEEARGAGMIRFSVLVTATVATPDELDDAETAVMARVAQSRLHMRPMYGTQAAAFAATLPAGVVLPAHTSISF